LAASVRLNFPHCIPPRNSATLSNAALAKGKGPELEIAIESPNPSTQTDASTEAQEEPKKKKTTKLAVVGTIQFVAAVQGLKSDLEIEEASRSEQLAIEAPPSESQLQETDQTNRQSQKKEEAFEIIVPQVKPLSPGEILGCTAPRLADDVDALL